MIITLIGMSNVGKTFWSKKLAEENGYMRYSCDDIIEEKLAEELVKLGYSGIEDVAKWMGMPYDKQYPETSSKYLSMEVQTMKDILRKLEYRKKGSPNVVIDTTGSVIYTGEEILNKLYRTTKVLYFETTEEERHQMFRSFIAEPKPLIWGNSFSMKQNEFKIDALARSYHNLLSQRAKLYKKYAHVTIPSHVIRGEEFTVSALQQYFV